MFERCISQHLLEVTGAQRLLSCLNDTQNGFHRRRFIVNGVCIHCARMDVRHAGMVEISELLLSVRRAIKLFNARFVEQFFSLHYEFVVEIRL